MPPGTGRESSGSTDALRLSAAERLAVWREPGALMLGPIVLGMALAEGPASDWLPLIMVDGYELSSAAGSLLYTLFTAAMAIGRFSGAFLIARFGRTAVVGASATTTAAGILIVVFAPDAALAAVGVALWGLGAALGFPVVLSAAGSTPHQLPAHVSAVATTGYLAFLAGPPLLGLLGEHTGLRNAMLAVATAALLAALLAGTIAKTALTPAA